MVSDRGGGNGMGFFESLCLITIKAITEKAMRIGYEIVNDRGSRTSTQRRLKVIRSAQSDDFCSGTM
jgi:hypothetical protein